MDDDDESLGAAYEDGHWVWDESVEALVYVSDIPPQPTEAYTISTKAPTGAIEFKDDVDFVDQIRFRRRYQRKIQPGQPDIITLQDVKDMALFTAPVALLSSPLINMLHLPTTERFLRALIICCQYFLQISEVMAKRMIELETKVRTPFCDILENEFRENMCDLRVLVAKEYCCMLMGEAELKKYHHMGSQKKRRSLSDKDARLIETLLRMSVQIVWLALGRKSFNQIELEVNRIFKSEIFNSVEHTLRTDYISKMSKEERHVLLGTCLRHDKKLNTQSPLLNEVFCHRPTDYRLTGIGVIKYKVMTARLDYLEQAVSRSEETMVAAGVTVGILGLPRSSFDTMLRPLPTASVAKGSASSIPPSTTSSAGSAVREKKSIIVSKLYPDIELPTKLASDDYFPDTFPDDPQTIQASSDVQRKRWQERLIRLLNPTKARRSSGFYL